jgi:putative NADH-flavin reductase
MKLAVFGGTGRTGVHVVRQALEQGHEVVVLARTPDKMGIKHDRLTVVQGDVTDKAAVAKAISSDTDAVISSLGPTEAGVKNIIAVMKSAGVKRLVVTAGAGVYRSGDNPPFISKFISGMIKTFSKDAYQQTYNVVEAVERSGLDWTILRAPRLMDKPATGNLYVGPLDGRMKSTLSREDYAALLLAQATDRALVGQAPVCSDK